jgi:hypothetical protein
MGLEYRQVGTETKYREEQNIVEQDLGYETVPVCRPKFVFFEFTGLRPSTPHWIFFDGVEVTKWVNTDDFTLASYNSAGINSKLRNPGDAYITATQFPAAHGGPTNASGPVDTANDGTLNGCFYIQSNDDLSFKTGIKTLTAIDISTLDKAKCLSYGQAEFVSHGLYEVYYEETITSQVAYQSPIYDWVQVPDPVPPASSSSGHDRGSSAPTFRSHYEPSTNTVTYFNEPLTHTQIQDRRKAAGGKFNKSLGGGKNGGGGGSGSSQKSKIVCTAMNNAYGFGGFRNAIWLKYAADHLTKEHEVGYHTIFMPLVDRAYNRGDKNNMFLRKVLEHIARHRSADIRAELRNGKRDKIGRIQRAFFEPLCYIVGKIKMRKQ